MRNIHILLFYKFEKIQNPERFSKEQLKFCKEIGVLGKILVAEEGINGSISGTKEQVERYKEFLRLKEGFSDIVFKEELSENHPFTKMVSRVKKEIVRIGVPVDLSKRGKRLSPKEFLNLYESGEDFILLDARNDYEYNVGRFKNAINSDIKTFRQFPKVAEKFKDKKDKKIIMYCTGGIRCEKASAYFIEQGFKDVSQLEGGIITFRQQFPDTVWNGKCFVFDKRLLTSDTDEKNPPITKCEQCGELCDLYRNCKNPSCDELVIMCLDCEKKMNACCSDKCLSEFMEHCREKSLMNQFKKKQGMMDISQ